GVPLPGGDFPVDGVPALSADLARRYPFLSAATIRRLIRHYGTEATAILGDAQSPDDLGQDFGAGLTAFEVSWLMDMEYARTAEDVVWRRTKLGLHLSADQIAALDVWMSKRGTA
ncbi:MAG: glycerol-3-phosphate dehydrogenase C-terminal domain-containing protein, partial [Albidovulum sp.]